MYIPVFSFHFNAHDTDDPVTDDPKEKRARPIGPLRLNLLTDDPVMNNIFMNDYEHDFMKIFVHILVSRTAI